MLRIICLPVQMRQLMPATSVTAEEWCDVSLSHTTVPYDHIVVDRYDAELFDMNAVNDTCEGVKMRQITKIGKLFEAITLWDLALTLTIILNLS